MVASRVVSLYQRILGHPFVYNNVRPMVVGIDYTSQYAALAVSPADVVLDIGCGSGDALRYLREFESYHGFDTDPIALAFAAERPEARRADVRFEHALVERSTLSRIAPTRVMMNGLLHHMADSEAIELIRMCAECPTIERVVSNDVVFLAGKHLNNLMARLDRGRHVRTVEGYRALVERGGLTVRRSEIVRSHPTRGIASYLVMVLEPARSPRSA
jgi:SAM-dependent methyltransferase